jgi:hypothetical protein
MLRNVNVPIMAPKRKGSLPNIACLIKAHRKRLQRDEQRVERVAMNLPLAYRSNQS